MVDSLVFVGWGLAEAGVKPGAVVPVDPFGGDLFDIVDDAQRSAPTPAMRARSPLG
jgi:hypothetical protein